MDKKESYGIVEFAAGISAAEFTSYALRKGFPNALGKADISTLPGAARSLGFIGTTVAVGFGVAYSINQIRNRTAQNERNEAWARGR